MTQPNQSELDGLWSLIDDHFDTALLSDEDTEAIEAYITANYTPINQPSTNTAPVTDDNQDKPSTNALHH